jgi:peptide/nickel transport system ATP-binding protein
MYGGRIVECADTETILKNPQHPYTIGLRNAFPDITERSQELVSIPGAPPDLVDPADQCRFAPRCPFAEEECWDARPTAASGAHHRVECYRSDEASMLRREGDDPETWTTERQTDRRPLEADDD